MIGYILLALAVVFVLTLPAEILGRLAGTLYDRATRTQQAARPAGDRAVDPIHALPPGVSVSEAPTLSRYWCRSGDRSVAFWAADEHAVRRHCEACGFTFMGALDSNPYAHSIAYRFGRFCRGVVNFVRTAAGRR